MRSPIGVLGPKPKNEICYKWTEKPSSPPFEVAKVKEHHCNKKAWQINHYSRHGKKIACRPQYNGAQPKLAVDRGYKWSWEQVIWDDGSSIMCRYSEVLQTPRDS